MGRSFSDLFNVLVGKDSKDLLNTSEQDQIDRKQRYYCALKVVAGHQEKLASPHIEGFDDIAWATDLLQAMVYSDGWSSRITAKWFLLWMDPQSPYLRRLCCADIVVWLLSEEVKYQRAANSFSIATQDPQAMQKQLLASKACGRIRLKKEGYLKILYGEHPHFAHMHYFDAEVAMRSFTHANEAIVAREFSCEVCRRSETVDVLSVRQFLKNIETDYEQGMAHLR